jgi:hypothetical protein
MRVIWLPVKKICPKVAPNNYDISKIWEPFEHTYFGSPVRIFNDIFVRFTFMDGKTRYGTEAIGVLAAANSPVPDKYLSHKYKSLDVPAGTYMVTAHNPNHEEVTKKLAQYGYIKDYINFKPYLNPEFSSDKYFRFPPRLQRICRESEQNHRFTEKRKNSPQEWKEIGNAQMADMLIKRILNEIEFKNAPPETRGALAVSFNVVNHSGAKPLMFINDRALVITTNHGEHFVTFTVDFEQKAVRISNGSHLAEFPLSVKLEQMIVNRIYNNQKDNFHDKIVF